MSEPTGARRYGVGGGDAYYDAVRYGGYEGTREQFGRDQAEFAQNAAAVAEAKETVERDAEEVRNTKNIFENTTVPEAIRALYQAGDDQILAITQKGEEVSQQVETVGTEQKDAVANEGRARVRAVEQAGTTQVQAVNDAGTTQVGNVNQAGEDQIEAVEQAGAGQVQAVTDEGDDQIQKVQDKGDDVLQSIPSDYTALNQKVDNLKESVEPNFFKIQDHIFGTNGGIYATTKVHRNASTMRRTTPIKLNEGDKIIAYLASTRAYLVMAFYSTETISEATYIDGVKGKVDTLLNRYEYTASQECYAVFSTYYTTDFENACVAIIRNYTNGENVLYTDERRISSDISSGDKIIPALIQYDTTIGANGNITSKSGDVITNKIYMNGATAFSLHSYGFGWLSINNYDINGNFLGRYEFTDLIIPSNYDFFVSVPVASAVHYTIICGIAYLSFRDIKINAFLGATLQKDFVNQNILYNRALIDSSAHRGWTVGYPENTLISTAQAKKHFFNAVENDVRFTSDGIAVLLHDESINRVARNSDGTEIAETINIEDITYEQALSYDFGIYAGSQFAGTKICTLEEQLKLCKKIGLKVWIEPKISGYASDIVGLVKKCGMTDNVVYIGFSSTILSQIFTLVPDAVGMLARSAFSTDYLSECTALKTSNNTVYAYLDYANEITQSNIDSMITNNIQLGLYTVNNYNAIVSLNPYVTKVCSTYYAADIIIAENQLNT